MPLYSLTLEKIKSLKENYDSTNQKLKETEEKSLEDFWLDDLKEI